MKKLCGVCLIEKEITEFSKKSSAKDGLNHCCKQCDRLRNIEWRLKNPEKHKDKNKKWRKENPQKSIYSRDKMLKSIYGLSEQQYNKQLEAQRGCCAICKKHHTKEKKALAVDHCHTTGTIRGLLCWRCNVSIGKFEDNVEILQSAINYLNNPPYEDKDE